MIRANVANPGGRFRDFGFPYNVNAVRMSGQFDSRNAKPVLNPLIAPIHRSSLNRPFSSYSTVIGTETRIVASEEIVHLVNSNIAYSVEPNNPMGVELTKLNEMKMLDEMTQWLTIC